MPVRAARPTRFRNTKIQVFALLLALYLPVVSALVHASHTCHKAGRCCVPCQDAGCSRSWQNYKTCNGVSSDTYNPAVSVFLIPDQQVHSSPKRCLACEFLQHFPGRATNAAAVLTPLNIEVTKVSLFYRLILSHWLFTCPTPRGPPLSSVA